MTTEEADRSSPRRELPLLLFRRQWNNQRKLRQLKSMLGPTRDLACLDIGGDGGVLSYWLRQRGGTWSSVEAEEPSFRSLETIVGERAFRMADGFRLPFEENRFDVVVVADMLEHVPDDQAFIIECHRVLKPAGRLVVHVRHHQRVCIMRPLRNLLGLSDESHGHVRSDYTESQLFEVLKDGFDVQEVRTYSGFLAETANTFEQWLYRRAGARHFDRTGREASPFDPEFAARVYRTAGIMYPLAAVLSKLDLLLFFCRGQRMLLRAKRRLWIPRKTPVLRDGRSIAEATLGARIGSASMLPAAEHEQKV